jgi:hypothetical protein
MIRRNFIRHSLAGTAGMIIAPTIIPSSVLGKNAPSNKINIGQIGFGRIAKGHDLPETLAYDVARVMAVADVDSNRLKDGKQFLEKYYNDKYKSTSYLNVKT